MPLVVVSGQPSSGKSSVAEKLQSEFQRLGHQVNLIDEPSLLLTKNAAYLTALSEKSTRGKLKSAVERAICKSSVTILDSINGIKGYRYELWCVSRAAGTRHCTVFVDTPPDVCRQLNKDRTGDAYSEEVLNDLLGRYETPDSRHRWDSPLFTVSWGSGNQAEVLAAVVDAMVSPSDRNVSTQVAKDLQPTSATTNPLLTGTNVLHDVDRAVQDVINEIVEVQAELPDGGSTTILRLPCGLTLKTSQKVNLAELRRHKRSFMKLATKITFSRIQDSHTAQRMFLDYLQENIGA